MIVDELGGVWMFSKKKFSKSTNLILVVSMIGIGTFSYIPIGYAESNQQDSTNAVVQEDQLANGLSKLEIEGITLDQAFSAEVNTYSATVENKIMSIQLKVETNDPKSLITVNDQSVTNGSTGPLLLQTGENTFLITVNDGSHPAKTYTLTITRKQSSNNLLQSIELSKGQLSPKFDSAITEYSVEVANDINNIILMPVAIENTATIKVNDSLVKYQGVSVQPPVGKSDIILLVTAENGDRKTYKIHVTRAAKQDNKQSTPTMNPVPNINGGSNRNNSVSQNSIQQNSITQNGSVIQKTSTATLSKLTVSSGTWDSTFSSSEFTYHVAVSSAVEAVTINPIANYSDAAISIEGGNSKTIKLTGKKTIISVVVTRNEDRKTYVLVFDK